MRGWPSHNSYFVLIGTVHGPDHRPRRLAALGAEARAAGRRVVFTNGIFDLLHVGHLRYLRAARALGDLLVVGLNDDACTRRLKGPRRPIVPQDERAELLAALEPVDRVVLFGEDTAVALIEALRPAVYVKGGDYAATPGAVGKPLPEAAAVRACGGDSPSSPSCRNAHRAISWRGSSRATAQAVRFTRRWLRGTERSIRVAPAGGRRGAPPTCASDTSRRGDTTRVQRRNLAASSHRRMSGLRSLSAGPE